MTTTTQSPSTDPARINPSHWASVFRFDQAQLRPAPAQILTIAGQGPLDADGTLQHEGDVPRQMAAAMDNVLALLDAAGMTLRDVFRLVLYVTDVDAALAGYQAVIDRLDAAQATPPATLVQVGRLAVPGMAVEIEATAGR